MKIYLILIFFIVFNANSEIMFKDVLEKSIKCYNSKNWECAYNNLKSIRHYPDPRVEQYLGILYSEGLGVEFNEQKAEHYLLNSHENFPSSERRLGLFIIKSTTSVANYDKLKKSGRRAGGVIYDFLRSKQKRGVKHLLSAASRGDDSAARNIYRLYRDNTLLYLYEHEAKSVVCSALKDNRQWAIKAEKDENWWCVY